MCRGLCCLSDFNAWLYQVFDGGRCGWSVIALAMVLAKSADVHGVVEVEPDDLCAASSVEADELAMVLLGMMDSGHLDAGSVIGARGKLKLQLKCPACRGGG